MIQYEIIDLPAASLPQLVGDIVSGAEKTMTDFITAHFSGVHASGKVVMGDAAEAIVNLAQSEGADIIIMATHGRQGLNRLLFGSVAEKVVKTRPYRSWTIQAPQTPGAACQRRTAPRSTHDIPSSLVQYAMLRAVRRPRLSPDHGHPGLDRCERS